MSRDKKMFGSYLGSINEVRKDVKSDSANLIAHKKEYETTEAKNSNCFFKPCPSLNC